ncbi:leucyl aminopeptidase [Lacihabitans sp. LS3-19]|uniref:leucyl aminopeptidase family protein n=1 Tax=Lacihabitans sp. LS3-19 TaxID=2487335 RepID=UPI0020CBB8C8|nr:leucyl aminopeptidase [Lacihabitans sp. LS3-19]MCP9768396.1 leucyl aminopeptidase [Lacihabitans sp. LS3-19]
MIKLTVNAAETFPILILPFFESENLQVLLNSISEQIGFEQKELYADFKAKAKETAIGMTRTQQKVYFLGLGNGKNPSEVSKVFRSFFNANKDKFKNDISVFLHNSQLGKVAADIAQGIFLGEYQIAKLKTAQKDLISIYESRSTINFQSDRDLQKLLERGRALAETQMKIMTWVDAPANYKTPQMVAAWIQESGKENGFEVEVFDEKACDEMGLKALLAVGRGSIDNPASFVVMKYTHPEAQKTVGLIGKGVTFDTGGVSLKPGDNMNYMKSDMGGAAAVSGTIEMAAKLKLKVNIVVAVPLTENCIDGKAVKPGDVIGSYSGKTIEVINTDAEGRLILADALAYVKKNHQPDVMIDLATLTGNCIQALGYAAAALLSNNDDLADSISKAGLETGEKVWRMPLWDDYKDMMKSDVADIKNLSTAPLAGAITAAKFLEEFIDGHTNWAHLDIAGVAFGDSEYGSMKSSTGFGVKLLVEWLETNL